MRSAPSQDTSPAGRERGRRGLGLAKAARRAKAMRRAALESLEPRCLMATLPAAIVAGQVDVSNSPNNGNETAPSIAIDPNSPQKLVAVWTQDNYSNPINNGQTPVIVGAAYSTNGGQSWTNLGGSLGNSRIDFTRNQDGGPFYFPQATEAQVAFGPNHEFYILSSVHTGDHGAGELLLQRFDFSGSTPTQTLTNQPVYRWTVDPAFRPMLAVDANKASYTDPDDGTHVQIDPYVGNVYVAWSTNNNTADSRNTQNPNPNTIKIVASSDGGGTFTTQKYVNDGGYVGNDRNATPRLAISQGRPPDPAAYGAADQGVLGGQVTVVWDDAGTLRDASPVPLDRIMSDRIQDGGTGVYLVGQGGPTVEAVDPGNSLPHVPGEAEFTIDVNITDPTFDITDLDVIVELAHYNLSQVAIDLIAPDGTTVRLLRNRTDSAGNTPQNPQTGMSGANLGTTGSVNATTLAGTWLGTVFDQQAPRSIFNNGGGVGSTGHFRPDGGPSSSLDVFNNYTAAQLTGTWTLRITDVRADNITAAPFPGLRSWALNITDGLSPGVDTVVATTTVRGPVANSSNPLSVGPLAPISSPNQGIIPAPVIASDNTLGAFSPNQGRLYVAYVDRDATPGNNNPADNTDIALATSDDGGRTWQRRFSPSLSGSRVNQDRSQIDGYTESLGTVAGRPQFLPAIAVDNATGTLVMSWYDTRDDAARARVATYVTTSIDGGRTFGGETYVNAQETAIDAVTGQRVVRGPLPENQSSGNTATGNNGLTAHSPYGYGDRQGLAVYNGQVYPAWAGNQNGGGDGKRMLDVYTARVAIGAGPRVVSSTMGPVGTAGDLINFTRDADGTPQVRGFNVSFDRPIPYAATGPNANVFDPSDIRVYFRDTTAGGVLTDITAALGAITITPNGSAGDPSDNGHFGYMNFAVRFENPQSRLGTYSYEILPNLRDRMRSTVQATTAAPPINASAVLAPSLPIPQSGTGGTGTFQDRVSNSITVSGHPNQIVSSLTVTINSLTHQRNGDLTIVLIAPNNTRVTLYQRPNDVGQNFTNTTFSSSAFQSILGATAPYSGSFRPVQSLSALNGMLADGTYTLEITDGAGGSIGFLSEWSLRINSVTPGVVTQVGSLMDQNANAATGETFADVYRVPDADDPAHTLPLIVPGAHVVGVAAHRAGTSLNTPGTDSLILNGMIDGIDVTFDRDMDPATISGSAVTRVQGPAGVLSGPYTFTPVGGSKRVFRIGFPNASPYVGQPAGPQYLSGTYTATFGPGITDAQGRLLDANLNAGVDLLRGGGAASPTSVQTYSAAAANLGPLVDATVDPTTGLIKPGVFTSYIDINDDFPIRAITLQFDITQPRATDLQATLIAPDGTSVKLFTNVGAAGSGSNFTNTTLDDATQPITPIQNAGSPFSAPGRYNPEQSMTTALIGPGREPISAKGRWTLVLQDDRPGPFSGGGTTPRPASLNYWRLNLTKSQPTSGLGEPAADVESASVRIFTMDPTNRLASSTWTAVGPASIGTVASGRMGGLAVDPSDPSGNTVYAAGASGGVWKTSNFLEPGGPTWIPLTDFGPTLGVNTGGIAVFGRNNDPNQSIIFVATGFADSGGAPDTAGVGFLRSMDGGATWTLLDSTNNDLPFNPDPADPTRPSRDHAFVGTSAFKVVVDPQLSPSGEVIVYAALSGDNGAMAGNQGGLWRSDDTGRTWQQIRAGQATDVVLDPASGTGGLGRGNLQIVYGAMRADDETGQSNVVMSTNRGQVFMPMLGGLGNPLIQDREIPGPVPVSAPPETPNGAKGRMALAKPALTGNPAQDLLYQGWLYVGVIDPISHFDGLYVTKDFGFNWTKIGIPTLPPLSGAGGAEVRAIPSNDSKLSDYDLGGGPPGTGFPAQGNYDFTLAINPTNPNILYMGGTADAQPTGFIRLDVSNLSDAHALVAYDNARNDGGQLRINTNNNAPLTLRSTDDPAPGPYYNLIRDPNAPFAAGATYYVTNAARFNNSGAVAKWIPFDFGITDQHRIVTTVDPLTGHARIIIGDDQGVHTAVDDDGEFDFGIGTARLPVGSRNGNLQVTQFYYGASQPSSLAAQIAGALFHGSAQDNGGPYSDPNILENGNISWSNPLGDAAGVATDPGGSGTLYQYWWPCCGGGGTDFFQVDGVGRTFGLVRGTAPGPTPDPQWPMTGGSNFAVNPRSGQQIIMSAVVGGTLYRTEDRGLTWFPIALPAQLDGSQVTAPAFGAPDPNPDQYVPNPSGNLDDFLYAGTANGNIFMTRTGGGSVGAGAAWYNISAGLSGGSVQSILTNPTPGSHEAYAVTSGGVFYSPDVLEIAYNGGTWRNITSNLFAITRAAFGDPNLTDEVLRYLTSIVADWRYLIPDASDPTSTHPILYVGGQGGVFRSLDNGASWTSFPDQALDGPPPGSTTPPGVVDGGFLPQSAVTDLDLAIGRINPQTGREENKASDPNVLLATTFGKGMYAIRMAPLVFNTAESPLALDPTRPAQPGGSDSGNAPSGYDDLITNVAQPFITGLSQQSAFGGVEPNVVRITLWNYDNPAAPVYVGGYDPSNSATDVAANWTDTTGRFSVQITEALTDGKHTIAVQATDQAGVKGNMALFTYTQDTTPPAAPNLPALEPEDDTDIAGDRITSKNVDLRFNVTGVSPNAKLELLRDGVVVNAIADVGAITLASTVVITDPGDPDPSSPGAFLPILDGEHLYTVRQSDVAGNASVESNALPVTVLTTTPGALSAPVLNMNDDLGVLNTDNYTPVRTNLRFSASGVQADAKLELLRDGVVVRTIANVGTPLGGGVVEIADTGPIADGAHVYAVRQTSRSGVVGPISAGLTVTIDTTAPAAPGAPALDPADGTGGAGGWTTSKNSNLHFSIDGVETNGRNGIVRLLRTNVQTGRQDLVDQAVLTAGGTIVLIDRGPLADGPYLYSAQQVDRAGNASPLSGTTSVLIDTGSYNLAAPVLNPLDDSGLSNTDGVTNVSAGLRFQATGLTPGSKLDLLRDDGKGGGPTVVATINTVGAAGTATIIDPGFTATPPDGLYLYQLRQTEPGGAISWSRTTPVTIDTTAPLPPPAAPVLDPADDTGISASDSITQNRLPHFEGVAAEGDGIIILVNPAIGSGLNLGSAPVGGDGSYRVRPDAPRALADNTYLLYVRQMDLAGNLSNPSPQAAPLTVLATAPLTPTLDLLRADDTGLRNNDYITSNAQPGFSGDAPAGNPASPNQVELIDVTGLTAPYDLSTTPPWSAIPTTDPGATPVLLSRLTVSPDNTFGKNPVFPMKPAFRLSDGPHTLIVRVVDAAGNVSLSSPLTVEIKTAPPVLAPAPDGLTLDLSPLDDTGAKGDGATSVRRPRFVGRYQLDMTQNPNPIDLQQPLTVELVDESGTVRASGAAASNGTYLLRLSSDLTNGRITLRAQVRDVAGNVAALRSAPLTVRIVSAPDDFDNDGKADPTIYVSDARIWTTARSSGGTTNNLFNPVGTATDVPLQGDLDGDGRADLITFQPETSTFSVHCSTAGPWPNIQFGAGGYARPALADYDGDGKTDLAIFQAAPGWPTLWVILGSTSGWQVVTLDGQKSDNIHDELIPVPGDYEGTGRAQLAVFHTAPGTGMEQSRWDVMKPADAQGHTSTSYSVSLGWPTVAVPMPGDFDGDGRTDFVEFQPAVPGFSFYAGGDWLVIRSLGGGQVSGWGVAHQAGYQPGDVAAASDYNGDGKIDFTVYRPTTGQFLSNTPGVAPVTPATPTGDPALQVPLQATYAYKRSRGLSQVYAFAPQVVSTTSALAASMSMSAPAAVPATTAVAVPSAARRSTSAATATAPASQAAPASRPAVVPSGPLPLSRLVLARLARFGRRVSS